MNIIKEYKPKHMKCPERYTGRERSKTKVAKRPFSIKALLCLYIIYVCSILSITTIENEMAKIAQNKQNVELTTHLSYDIHSVHSKPKVYTNSIEDDPSKLQSSLITYTSTDEPKLTSRSMPDETEPVVEEYAIQTIEPEIEPTPELYHQDDFSGDSSVMCMSGLTAEQIEGMLDEYPGLDGLGEAIYNVEQENGVNAFYTLAVASLESGYGKSQLAKSKNNLFGLMGCTFESRESCVAYFGRLMINYQDKHDVTMTPNGINPRYCTTDSWATKVTQLMNQWAHKANDMY